MQDLHEHSIWVLKAEANKPAAGNAGIAPQLTIGHHWPGVPESERWPYSYMNIIHVLVVFLLATLVGCGPRATVQVPDVTKLITLTVSPGDGRHSRGVSVHLRGYLDGSALVIWDSELTTNRLSGKIDVSHRDNYSTNFTLHYIPETVRTGMVSMQYVFH
jgi:hypothetical protein